MALGYLNQAIEDLCTNLRAGRGIVGLMAAPITGVERYGGARPNFSLHPDQPPRPQRGGNLRHVGAAHRSGLCLKWYQQLVLDPTFQAARQERDRQRVFLRR